MHSKIISNWLSSYINAAQPVLATFKKGGIHSRLTSGDLSITLFNMAFFIYSSLCCVCPLKYVYFWHEEQTTTSRSTGGESMWEVICDFFLNWWYRWGVFSCKYEDVCKKFFLLCLAFFFTDFNIQCRKKKKFNTKKYMMDSPKYVNYIKKLEKMG